MGVAFFAILHKKIVGMNNNNSEAVICQETFQEIIKKANERGTSESQSFQVIF
jgi:uncharacterized protein (UPF0333 family)